MNAVDGILALDDSGHTGMKLIAFCFNLPQQNRPESPKNNGRSIELCPRATSATFLVSLPLGRVIDAGNILVGAVKAVQTVKDHKLFVVFVRLALENMVKPAGKYR